MSRRALLMSSIGFIAVAIPLIACLRRSNAPGAGKQLIKSTAQDSSLRLERNYWRIPAVAKERYLQDTMRLSEDIILKPCVGTDPDSIAGLSIAKLSPDSPMALAGFKVGDRILRVNDKQIDSMSRAINLAQEIRRSAYLTVQVERAGKIVDYRFDFE